MTTLSFHNGLLWTVAAGAIALVAAMMFRIVIGSQDPGTPLMQKIAAQIRTGAMAFLTREYSVIIPFMLIVAAVLTYFLGVPTGASFLIGALCSGLAGFIGMRTATIANVRTAHAATVSVGKALRVSFLSGATMGFSVVGLGLLGFTGALLWLLRTMDINAALQAVTGFGFGASCVALFARVGGGIYTKAADVGADLVGKVEAGIPEDDPRNPAVIADSVGDNVGDVAGMGADLFESYVGAILATMLVGLHVEWGEGGVDKALLFPLLVSGIGCIASIIATAVVRTKRPHGVQAALKNGMLASALLMLLGTYWLCVQFLPSAVAMGVFLSLTAGLIAGVLIGLLTEYYTSHSYHPVRTLAASAKTGAATTLIEGLALGYMSTALPVLVIAIAIAIAYLTQGLYGIGVGAVGMLSTLGMTLAVDAFGPVADNAGGIAEMAKLHHEVRERTDALDSAGNTTAAIGKGFAIGVAAFMVLALFGAFKENSGLTGIDVSNPFTLIGLLIGGMIPYLFSSLTMRAVGRAAVAMIEEVRRQFREIKGLMEGTAEADSATCVAIATSSAIRQMVLPGLLAIVSPVLTGLLLGREALGGLLAGTLVSSVMLGMSMSNSGGAWDNAKKYIESGHFGGKGSDPHKAAVVGDTVGDPFKDTSGPSLNILVKLMSMVSVLTASLYSVNGWWH